MQFCRHFSAYFRQLDAGIFIEICISTYVGIGVSAYYSKKLQHVHAFLSTIFIWFYFILLSFFFGEKSNCVQFCKQSVMN